VKNIKYTFTVINNLRMAIVLFDKHIHGNLLPLTYTRSVAGIRSGILTIKDYWEKISGEKVFVETVDYLQGLYLQATNDIHLFIDAAVFATDALSRQILSLQANEALIDNEGLIACKYESDMLLQDFHFTNVINLEAPVRRFKHPWNFFQWNTEALKRDYQLITSGRESSTISATNHIIHAENIFIEEGAIVEYALLNATEGPIYIDKKATVMEGSFIRGPFALGEGAILKMGAKIYGATTLGPGCVAGGELKNVIMQAYSNKAHDGYLGDSVIGEWCNFGAGTSNSNVKNTASEIKMWSLASRQLVNAGIKCGLVMGDYSRTAINTALNSGTTVGVCCNIFGEGLTPKVLHSFTWGMKGLTRYEFEKALKDIDNWKKFKHQSLSDDDTAVLKHIFEHFSD